MRTKCLLLAALLCAVPVAGGCITSPTELVGSTVPLEPGSYDVVGETTGTTLSGFMMAIHLIPIQFGPEDPAGEARDLAIQNAGGGGPLIDVAMDRILVFVPIPLLHIVLTITKVEGKLVRARPLAPPAPTPPVEAPGGSGQ